MFLGCSLFLICELIQLVLFVSTPLSYGNPSLPNLNARISWSVFSHYCEAATLHGVSFIRSTKTRLGRCLWAFLVLAAMGTAAYFSILANMEFRASRFENVRNEMGNNRMHRSTRVGRF